MILLLDRISIERIDKLHPRMREYARMLLDRCSEKKIYIRFTDTLRTYDEQNKLYEQGRTTPGKIVTNARGGYSWHNYGLALDFCLLKPDLKSVKWDRQVDFNGDDEPDWMTVVLIAKGLGFEWGGDWEGKKVDFPHLQMRFGKTIDEARAIFRDNQVIDKSYIKI